MSVSFSGSIQDLYSTYKNWVCSNPKQASDVEAFAKWVSYFIAGRVNDSTIPSELVYSLSNLLVFFNDRVIEKARRGVPQIADQLKTWLTVVEYVEVFIEISTRRLWGEKGRWIIVVCLQLLKCVGRLLLVFRHKEWVTQTPPIPPLRRDALGEVAEHDEKLHIQSASFILKRSGRVIRRVEMGYVDCLRFEHQNNILMTEVGHLDSDEMSLSPPIRSRAWKPIELPVTIGENKTASDEQGTVVQTIAECLYIMKPVLHLCSMCVSGQKAWKPWLLSLAVDIASLQIHQRSCPRPLLSQQQQLELSRRLVALCLYALRSPFYDRHSRQCLLRALRCMGRSVPLLGTFVGPLLHYLPVWQDTYFYLWST